MMQMDDNGNLPMQVGEVRGRLGALEDRVGRHELFVGDALREIGTSVKGMDDKLDKAFLVQEQGVTMQRIFRWAITAVLGASGWLALLVRGH